MEPKTIGILGLMALLFVLWAASMFRLLWKLNQAKNAKAREQGKAPSGLNIGITMAVYASALTAPEFASDRKRLLVLTPALFLVIALSSQILGTK